MGKSIRLKRQREEALYNAQMAELQKKTLPKKQNKRSAPINLPAICTQYPHQRSIDSFKSSSCSPARRSAQLLRHLYCAYQVPSWLIDWMVREGANETASPAHERSVALLMSIIYEIGSGRSPRHILKPYFSKAEMALFFKLRGPADMGITAFAHFVYCRARAKGLPDPVCLKFVQLTSEIRLDRADVYEFVQRFVDFCATRAVNAVSVQDIWDYLSCNRLVGKFSFKGRTLASMLNLVNAWHDELNRDARALADNRIRNDWHAIQYRVEALKMVYKEACGIPGKWSVVDSQTGQPVEVLQLTKYAELINEGRAMHNCVAAYHQRCAQNSCQIFSLRIAGERKATIEVRDKTVVQARGNCNQNLAPHPLQCLRKWMGKFNLKEGF